MKKMFESLQSNTGQQSGEIPKNRPVTLFDFSHSGRNDLSWQRIEAYGRDVL